jgi:hypothetical protein
MDNVLAQKLKLVKESVEKCKAQLEAYRHRGLAGNTDRMKLVMAGNR